MKNPLVTVLEELQRMKADNRGQTKAGALDVIIGIFIIFIVGIEIFSGTLIANNALLNLAWTVGVPVAVLLLVFRAGGVLR